MKYCSNCGNELKPEADVCLNCGKNLRINNIQSQSYDNGGLVWGLLGFCFPMIGLILYLIWSNEKPLTAKAVGMGALIWFILVILYSLFFVAIAIFGY